MEKHGSNTENISHAVLRLWTKLNPCFPPSFSNPRILAQGAPPLPTIFGRLSGTTAATETSAAGNGLLLGSAASIQTKCRNTAERLADSAEVSWIVSSFAIFS